MASRTVEGAFDRYTELLVSEFRPVVLRHVPPRKREMSDSMMSALFDARPAGVPAAQLSSAEAKIRDLFQDIIRVSRAYDVLLDHEVYARRFPYPNTRVNRGRHLHTVIASYFENAYIFKERVKRHLNLLKRTAKKSPLRGNLESGLAPLFHLLSTAMTPIGTLRGIHVHDKKFKDWVVDTVEDYDWMVGVGVWGEAADTIKGIVTLRYRDVRKQWTERVSSTNADLGQLRDLIFQGVLEVVEKDGRLALVDG